MRDAGLQDPLLSLSVRQVKSGVMSTLVRRHQGPWTLVLTALCDPLPECGLELVTCI